jgi:hypothetical protein
MAGRIRSLKPEWLEDELLQDSSSDARVLTIGLILLADDHGRGRGGEKFLAGTVFPGQPIKVTRDALSRLVEIRYCRTYVVDGQSYFEIRNWAKHQRVDKPGKAKVPEPPGNTLVSPGSIDEALAPRARPLPSHPFQSSPEESAERNHEPAEPVAAAPSAPVDRETVCPMDLPVRADAVGIPEQFAKAYGVQVDVVRHHIEETRVFWTIGGGAGRRKRNWMLVLRTRLHELGKARGLVVPADTPDIGAPGRLAALEAARNARLERESAEAHAELERRGQAPVRDVTKLVGGIGE